MTHGLALIGCGLVGQKRLRALPLRLKVVSLMDVHRERAEAIANSLDREVYVARTIEEAVSAPGVDVAIVATVHASLVPASIVALEAGCHVLVEKPGACRVADLLQLQKSASLAGKIVRVGFNHRFHPAVVKSKELIAQKDYGSLIYIRGRYGHGGRVGYESEWRADRALSGGGELLDQGVHLIDLARHVAGDLDLVFAETRTDFWDTDVEDNAFLALRAEGGGFIWLHASWTEWKNLFSLEIALQTAKLEIHGLGGSYGIETLTCYEMSPEMGPPLSQSWQWPEQDTSWAEELEDFVSSIAGSSGAGAQIDDAIAALSLVEEAYERGSSTAGA